METKSSYSSMAAKPPPKVNDATTNGQQPTKAKNPSGPKRNPDRFLGHNQTDLKGILIPEDANAKLYNELKDRLETLDRLKYIPQSVTMKYLMWMCLVLLVLELFPLVSNRIKLVLSW
eukprot:jgi/Psemu1/41694/gm1.41694_g